MSFDSPIWQRHLNLSIREREGKGGVLGGGYELNYTGYMKIHEALRFFLFTAFISAQEEERG